MRYSLRAMALSRLGSVHLALNVFVAEVPKLSPIAFQIQGYKLNRAIFNPTAARLGQAIAGEMSLDDALKRISADIDEQVKAAAK